MASTKVFTGDCYDALQKIDQNSIDLVYLDPPFFTQKIHKLSSRGADQEFSFSDLWKDHEDYAEFLFDRLLLIKKCLKDTGSIFFHCDKSASHVVRLLLDEVFGSENFQSEIIWSYKRWSNSKKGLLPSHQTIFFYSKTSSFKFNTLYQNYSATTNVDQIMQKRTRDQRNKAVYARDSNGEIISSGNKKGVPLSDVWDIPYLNPKAKERVGYPTQKPVLLLKRIIEMVTDKNDIVLDPFCGSGTTLLAAQYLDRSSIGMDISEEAVELTNKRLKEGEITESALLNKGQKSYEQQSEYAKSILNEFEYVPIQRNKGIDGLLKEEINEVPIFVRVQRPKEDIDEAASLLIKASKNKGKCDLLLIQTQEGSFKNPILLEKVQVIPSASCSFDLLKLESQKPKKKRAAS